MERGSGDNARVLRGLLLGWSVAAVCGSGEARAPAPVRSPTGPELPARSAPGSASASATGSTSVPAIAAAEAAIASSDECPDAPETRNGYRDADGCPDELPPELAAITGVLEGVVFELEKDIIRTGTSRETLDRIAEVLQRVPEVRVEIRVHTAHEPGMENYGRCLSCRRAGAIRSYLISRGVEPARLEAEGYESSMPIDDNRTLAGRRRNRRVEILLRE